VDAAAACAGVVKWVEENLLTEVSGVPDDEPPVWRVSRVDIAADITGVELSASDLARFTTRARSRESYHYESLAEATTRTVGRRLSGFTFGKRGGGVYARIYDKTLESAGGPDEALSEHWIDNGWDGESRVWRVEFEVRNAFLREMRDADGSRLNRPDILVDGTSRLGAVWGRLVSGWLVLRVGDESRTRIERRAVAPWWRLLAELDTLDGPSGRAQIVRAGPQVDDVVPLLRQATGVLVAVGAVQGTADLGLVLEAVRAHIDGISDGPDFASRVARRDLRARAQGRVTDRMVERLAERLRGPV